MQHKAKYMSAQNNQNKLVNVEGTLLWMQEWIMKECKIGKNQVKHTKESNQVKQVMLCTSHAFLQAAQYGQYNSTWLQHTLIINLLVATAQSQKCFRWKSSKVNFIDNKRYHSQCRFPRVLRNGKFSKLLELNLVTTAQNTTDVGKSRATQHCVGLPFLSLLLWAVATVLRPNFTGIHSQLPRPCQANWTCSFYSLFAHSDTQWCLNAQWWWHNCSH